MAQACSPVPAALASGLPAWPTLSCEPPHRGGGPPSCEVCHASDAVVFCRNDKAYLCAVCDQKIHQSNPLASRHEIVVLKDSRSTQECSEGSPQDGDDLVRIEIGGEGQLEGRTSASDLSGVSSTSDQCLLKCTAGDALLDALNDPSVLELFPGDTLDGGMEDFQDVELDSEWIETLEKEGAMRETRSSLAQTAPKQEQNVEDVHQVEADRPTPSISQAAVPDFQSLFCAHNPFGGPTIAAAPQCPMPIIPFLPIGPWDTMAAGFPFAPPPVFPLQSPQSLLDRKARVARYREKRKHRSFENKIRYTSRKLYAENRPRIKGRFARPDELEAYLKEKEAGGNQEGGQFLCSH